MLTRRPLQRCYMEYSKEADAIQIHRFSDASEKGFSAVVYIRILCSDSTVSISLMAAKTKVAPIKRESIPRLELSGALLLAKLLDSVKTTLDFFLSQIYAWSDSKIVLAWLDGSPRRLQTYVVNSVMYLLLPIQQIVPQRNATTGPSSPFSLVGWTILVTSRANCLASFS